MTRFSRNIVVTVALVTIFTTASAAAALAIRSADIVNGEVKTVDLADKAVTNAKFAANSVTGAKLNESTLGIVPNANQLDGRDSTSFLAGPGRILASRATVNRGALVAVFSSTVGGQIGFNLAYQCPNGSVPARIEFRNRSDAGWDVGYQDGGDDPWFVQVLTGATTQFSANEQSHSIKFRIVRQSDRRQATVFYSLIGEATSCKTAALAMLFNP